MMEALAIVQARMSSSRLPGKVLHPIGGRPMLGYLLDRLARARTIGAVVVATSVEKSDAPIAAYCAASGVGCHRGPLADVARRFQGVIEAFPAGAYVRICADSPLLDPEVVDGVVELFSSRHPDLATNTYPRSYPKGQSVEVFSAEAFHRACARMETPEDREHVTRIFYRHPEGFTIRNLNSGRGCGERSLAIDTPEEMAAFEELVAAMDRPHWTYRWEELLNMKQALGG